MDKIIPISCDDCGDTAYFGDGNGFVSGKVICLKCSTNHPILEE